MKTKIIKQNIIVIKNETLTKIREISQKHTYTVDTTLYYEGQTPIVAYLLLEGQASLVKKRRKSN